MMVALTIVCAACCGGLVVAEWRRLAGLRVITKLAASAAFVALGTQAFRIGHDPARVGFGQAIFVGLVLGALGDAALLGRGKPWFLAGLGAFLLGHLAYVAAIAQLAAPTTWLGAAGLYAVLPIAAGASVLAHLWPRLGNMRAPVIAYVVVIVVMVIAAIAIARAGALPESQRRLLLAGAVLFFVSDVAVARDRFVARALVNKLWGLPAYYAGQLLIAWSLAGL